MSEPLSVSVVLPASGEFGNPDIYSDRPVAERVEYRAAGGEHLTVSVTAYSRQHANQTWMFPEFFVADGLDSSEPPEWVPAAPAWFWDAVGQMGGVR